MSFGMYGAAFFCSPLYFALRRRWVAAAAHGILYLLAVALIVSLIGAIFGVLLWFFGVAHATWDLRSVMMEQALQRQAELIAQKMAKEAKSS